jgi:hypothetical protein
MCLPFLNFSVRYDVWCVAYVADTSVCHPVVVANHTNAHTVTAYGTASPTDTTRLTWDARLLGMR